MLKVKREKVPLSEYAPFLSVVVAIAFILLAFRGNFLLSSSSFQTFIFYLIEPLLVVMMILDRSIIISTFLVTVDAFFRTLLKLSILSSRKLTQVYFKVHSQEFVFYDT